MPATTKKCDKRESERPVAELVPPWAIDGQHRYYSVADASPEVQAEMLRRFLEERTRAHETYIRETQKTQRHIADQRTKQLSLFGVVACVIAACIVLVFAPPGREHIGYGAAATLVVLAASVAGYRFFRAKLPLTEMEASSKSA